MNAVNRKKWIRTITAVIVFTVLLIIYIGYIISPDVVYTYHGNSGEKIVVYREREIDYGELSYYYIVFQGGRKLVGPCVILPYADPDLEPFHFDVVTAPGNPDVVAIIETDYPHIILAVHDFASSQSYPAHTSTTITRQQSKQIGYNLIQSLPPSGNDRAYVLSGEASSDDWVNTKPGIQQHPSIWFDLLLNRFMLILTISVSEVGFILAIFTLAPLALLLGIVAIFMLLNRHIRIEARGVAIAAIITATSLLLIHLWAWDWQVHRIVEKMRDSLFYNLMTSIPLLLGLLVLAVASLLKQHRPGTCLKCGYDLRGITDHHGNKQCPECGMSNPTPAR